MISELSFVSPPPLTLLLKLLAESLANDMANGKPSILVGVSIDVKRHTVNLLRKTFNWYSQFQKVSPLLSWQRTWQHAGKCGPG